MHRKGERDEIVDDWESGIHGSVASGLLPISTVVLRLAAVLGTRLFKKGSSIDTRFVTLLEFEGLGSEGTSCELKLASQLAPNHW